MLRFSIQSVDFFLGDVDLEGLDVRHVGYIFRLSPTTRIDWDVTGRCATGEIHDKTELQVYEGLCILQRHS